MKPIVKNDNQKRYNAYEINLNVDNESFSSYYCTNLVRNCRIAQAEKALKLYLSKQTIPQINAILSSEKSNEEYERPMYLSHINFREDLIKYCYDMITGEYDFPDDYLDTVMIDEACITRMEDDEIPFYFFPHDTRYTS